MVKKKLEALGYGIVFEGEFDDQRVVLKESKVTNLGNVRRKLLAEILTISRFLVALLGFCDEKSNEIILVYEYVSSGCWNLNVSLETFPSHIGRNLKEIQAYKPIISSGL